MTDGLIMGALAFIGALIVVIKPIITLNASIVKLNTTLEGFEKTYEENHKKLEGRVNEHGKRIGGIEKEQVSHGIRLNVLEKREGLQ